MARKVFDPSEIDKLNLYQLQTERGEVEKEVRRQIQMLNKFGSGDKYYNQRGQHINVLYRKRYYIEKKMRELKEQKKNGK